MGTLMQDEELFVQTQAQQEDNIESDNVYLELAKAITERKCRILQKKEKLKLMINDAMKLREKLISVKNEEKSLKKDIEEVSGWKSLQVKNIENAQKSCSTLETTLCDLTNKVSEEKAETKRKKDEYNAAVKDAHETWESYKEKYESFPLAKKLREVVVEVKKVEIKLKQVEMDTADAKMKRKLKHDIAERKFHLTVVQLAEKYKLYQEKLSEHKDLQEKNKKMKNLIADIKSGKATSRQLESTQGSANHGRKGQHEVRPQPDIVKFTVSGIQVTSPPPPASESSAGGKLFDWGNLLSSTRLLGFSKTPTAKTVNTNLNSSLNKMTLTSSAVSATAETLKKKTLQNVKNVGSSLSLTNLLRNKTVPQSKGGPNVGVKRDIPVEGNKQERPPCKKMLVTSQSNASSDSQITQVNENLPLAVIRKDVTKENLFTGENKENTNPRISNNSSNINSLMSSLSGNIGYRPITAPTSKDMGQSLMNKLSQGKVNVRKVSEASPKEEYKQAKTTQNTSANSQPISQRDQNKNFHEELSFQNVGSNQPTETYEITQIMLEPRSPAPDLVPVETNSQENSQGNILQTCSPIDFNLSGGSDFVSPDVDEQTKMVYQRMMSEGPYPAQEYSRENAMNSQKSTLEQTVIRSQYFADSDNPNAPNDDQGNYQSPVDQPFSSPIRVGEFENIPSPPAATTGDFNFGGSGSAPGSSAFSFAFSNKNTSNKSVFDFF